MTLVGKNVWKMVGLLLVVSLISLAVISGTFAKYTSTLAGHDTALVAKWDITGTGDNVALSDGGTADLDLFDHSYTNNMVTGAGTDKIIAPGVKGDFVLKFKNDSDVAAKVTFDGSTVTGTAAAEPIMYSLTSSADGDLALDKADLIAALNEKFENIDPGTTTDEVKVYWGWKFYVDNAGDTADTTLGKASAAAPRTTYILTINAKAEQLEPTIP